MSEQPPSPTPRDGEPPRSLEGKVRVSSALTTTGLVAGVLGLTAMVFGVLLYAIDPHAVVITTVNFAFAATALAFYGLTNKEALSRIASGRSTPLVALEVFLILGILLAVLAANFFAAKSTKEWDLTKDQLFTLEEQSQQVARSLTKPVKILGFFKPTEQQRGTLAALVELYQRHTNQISLELINAESAPPAVVKKYQLSATGPRIVVIAGEDRVTKIRAPTEKELTNALVRVAERPPRKIYFLVGHGEPGMAESAEPDLGFVRATEGLRDQGYVVETLSLVERDNVPLDAALVILAGSKKPPFPNEVQALIAYARVGGRLALFLDPGVTYGLEPLLNPLGVEVGDNLVVDPNPAAQAYGFGPDAPLITKFEAHPITNPLKGSALILYWTRSVAPIVGSAGVSVVTLLQTSDASWGESRYHEGGDVARDENDVPGPVPVAVAVHKSTLMAEGKRNDDARMVVVGDSSFATNRFFAVGGNGDFFLNIVGWLAGDEHEISIRPKLRGATSIPLTEAQLYGIVFVSVNLLPLLIVGFGFSVWAVRRRS